MSKSTSNSKEKGDPIDTSEEVKQNPDPKIDQDFEGFPANPATQEKVNPKTPGEKKSAGNGERDGEKKLDAGKNEPPIEEGGSDGSANAFERTERQAIEPHATEHNNTIPRKRRSDGSANAFERTEGSPLDETDEEEGKTYY
ncbi:MAG: hypothetical protein ABWZ25_05250 [Chitinophagaceae bacterium]